MQQLAMRAHLSAVPFAPKAYLGCGGWDLAKAPRTTGVELEDDRLPTRAATRATSRPRRVLGCGGGGYAADPTPIVDLNEDELAGAGCRNCSTGVKMGCGDEKCEACAEMGCLKCKRARKKAIMNQNQELGASWIGQNTPETNALVGLGVAGGLLYLALNL